MPRGTNAPKLWPAEPRRWMRIVLSGRPAPPHRFVTSEPSIVPTVRFVLRTGLSISTGVPSLERGGGLLDQLAVERALEAVILAAACSSASGPRTGSPPPRGSA